MPVLCRYSGADQRHYPDYLDSAAGRTLTADPGGIYDVAVASGRNPGLLLPPGDGRWVPAPPAQAGRPSRTAARQAAAARVPAATPYEED